MCLRPSDASTAVVVNAVNRLDIAQKDFDSMSAQACMVSVTACPIRCPVSKPMSAGSVPIPTVESLTAQESYLVKSSAPLLAKIGINITALFYDNMINSHPELKDLFSESGQRLGHQAQALASAVYAYAQNIEDLTPLLPAVERIAHKHASLHVIQDQYHLVGNHLIQALSDILGDAFTPQLKAAWCKAFWNLANVFIGREKELYQGAKEQGGWEGWKKYRVAKRAQESEEITSFSFQPWDEKESVPIHKAGQYIAVMSDIKVYGHKQARQYSLSDKPDGKSLRISVKREPGPADPAVTIKAGLMSNTLHDSLSLGDSLLISAPYGEFGAELGSKLDGPLVLLSAGVGQTPLLSMLNAHLEDAERQPISYITVARNAQVHAFRGHLRSVAEKHDNICVKVFYSAPAGSTPRLSYDFLGRLDLSLVKNCLHLDDSTTQYFICGPKEFMTEKQEQLKDMGVSGDRVHIELFASG